MSLMKLQVHEECAVVGGGQEADFKMTQAEEDVFLAAKEWCYPTPPKICAILYGVMMPSSFQAGAAELKDYRYYKFH
jgi:hypothetical protein